MKLPCEMVKDLLPLYYDGVCSEISKALVTEHLKTCQECQRARNAMDSEIAVPETEAARPLKNIGRKWKKKTWQKGILIGLAVAVASFVLWFSLTQNSSVAMKAEEYTITQACRFENGMVYLEYKLPFESLSYSADIHRTAEGEIHVRHYRPLLVKKNAEKGTIRDFLIDPQNNLVHADTGEVVPLTAFYLGCPETEESVLLWSADMEIPMATPEQEEKYLYNWVFR